MASFFEFPIFTGVSGELRPWISWLEDFFVRENFTAMEKMNLAQSLLEGEAEAWFYRIQKTLIFYSWKELKDKLLLRFGDFADSDRIRLIVELDRFLQEIRDEARIQRMKTTSIPVKDTITVVEETSEIVAGNLAERASEKKLVSQYQVPVSSLEPSLSFSSEPLHVSASWPCAIVGNNPVYSQSGFECVKNMNDAHHVFDELSHRRHKCQPRKKLSLSPKSWMFKFKNMTLPRNWSQLNLHQVIDISKVNNLSPGVSANFGLVRKHRTFQCLRLKTQAHKSRVQYHLRRLHDPGGNKDEHSDDIFETEVDMNNVQRTPMDIVAASVTTTPDTVASSSNVVAPSTDVITKRQIPDGAVVKYSETATYVQAMQTAGLDEACDAEIDALDVVNKPVTECKNDRVIATALERQVDVESATGANGANGGGDIDALPPPPPILPPNVEPLQGHFYHYSVALFYDDGRPVEAKGIGRKILDKVYEPYHSDLDGKEFAYDGEKTLFTYGVLPDNKMDFAVVLEEVFAARTNGNASPNGNENDGDRNRLRRPTRTENFTVEISYAAKILLQALANAMRGQESENFQEALCVLDIILRQHAARQGCLLVRQSFFHTDPTNCEEVGGNILGCRGLGQLILDNLKSHVWHKWKSKHLHPISALEVYLSSVLPTVTSATSSSLLPRYAYQMRVSDIQDNDNETVADPRLTVLRVLCLLGTLFWRTSFKKPKFGKNWWYKFKHSL